MKVLFYLILIWIAWTDWRTRRIPDRLVLAALVTGCLSGGAELGLASRLIGAACVSGVLLFAALCAPGSFGGGDIKLMAACGLALGGERIVAAFFWALVFGSGYGLWLTLVRKRGWRARFPFGPALCTGMILADFFCLP